MEKFFMIESSKLSLFINRITITKSLAKRRKEGSKCSFAKILSLNLLYKKDKVMI